MFREDEEARLKHDSVSFLTTEFTAVRYKHLRAARDVFVLETLRNRVILGVPIFMATAQQLTDLKTSFTDTTFQNVQT